MWKSLFAVIVLVLAVACETTPSESLNLTVRSDDQIQPSLSDTAAWEKHTPWTTDATAVIPLSNGVTYVVLASGDPAAASPELTSLVAVYYQVRLATSGAVIDESFGASIAPILSMRNVVDGWRDALTQMHPGDRWLIYVSAARAYGKDGSANVPPDADLIFEVKLLGVTG